MSNSARHAAGAAGARCPQTRAAAAWAPRKWGGRLSIGETPSMTVAVALDGGQLRAFAQHGSIHRQAATEGQLQTAQCGDGSVL